MHIPVTELQVGDEFPGGPIVISLAEFGARIRVETLNPVNNYEFVDFPVRTEMVKVSRKILA